MERTLPFREYSSVRSHVVVVAEVFPALQWPTHLLILGSFMSEEDEDSNSAVDLSRELTSAMLQIDSIITTSSMSYYSSEF